MTHETQHAFAKRIGKSDAYVSQLREAGLLVMVGDGKRKRVDVEASLARIAEAEDPSKAGVRLRHAREREDKGRVVAPPPDEPDDDDEVGEQHGARGKPTPKQVYTHYQALKMKSEALMAARAEQRDAGLLVPREAVEFALSDISAGVRARLEAAPDRLSPIVYPLETLEETRAALVEFVEDQLQALSQHIERRARDMGAARGG